MQLILSPPLVLILSSTNIGCVQWRSQDWNLEEVPKKISFIPNRMSDLQTDNLKNSCFHSLIVHDNSQTITIRIGSLAQIADIFTKALSVAHFLFLKFKLPVVEPPRSLQGCVSKGHEMRNQLVVKPIIQLTDFAT